MLLGAHESTAGGMPLAIERAVVDGCRAVQIFSRPSQQWQARPLPIEELSQWRSEHAAVGWPTMAHSSYLINICADNPVFLKKSRLALEEELLRAEELGLDYVVLHPGAHMGRGEQSGLVLAARTLSWVAERTRGFHVRLLLELTAGQGSCLGCTFEHLGWLLDRTAGDHRMGVCLDTCHAFAAGYDLTTDEGYERAFEELDRFVGLSELKAFHLNDSKTPLGSRVDRHQEIGDGHLGLYPFWRILNDPRFTTIPGVLETPSGPDGKPSFARNLARLRALEGAPRPARERGQSLKVAAR